LTQPFLDNNKMTNIFYVYYLRRPDKVDPLESGDGQPFYVGKGKSRQVYSHRGQALGSFHKPGRKSLRISIIHKLWRQNLDFTEEIMVDGLSEKEAFDLEMEAISIYGRIDLGTGCLANLTDGGEGGIGAVRSEEFRRNVSIFQKGNTWMLGKHHTDDAKRRIGEASKGNKYAAGQEGPWKGKKLPKEICEKIRQANTGKKQSKEQIQKRVESNRKKSVETGKKISKANTGKHHTPETKANMRESWKNREPISLDTRLKIGNTVKLLWENEEYRQQMVDSHKGYVMPEEQKEKIRASMKKAMEIKFGPKRIPYK
jgi:hypothetical protein